MKELLYALICGYSLVGIVSPVAAQQTVEITTYDENFTAKDKGVGFLLPNDSGGCLVLTAGHVIKDRSYDIFITHRSVSDPIEYRFSDSLTGVTDMILLAPRLPKISSEYCPLPALISEIELHEFYTIESSTRGNGSPDSLRVTKFLKNNVQLDVQSHNPARLSLRQTLSGSPLYHFTKEGRRKGWVGILKDVRPEKNPIGEVLRADYLYRALHVQLGYPSPPKYVDIAPKEKRRRFWNRVGWGSMLGGGIAGTLGYFHYFQRGEATYAEYERFTSETEFIRSQSRDFTSRAAAYSWAEGKRNTAAWLVGSGAGTALSGLVVWLFHLPDNDKPIINGVTVAIPSDGATGLNFTYTF